MHHHAPTWLSFWLAVWLWLRGAEACCQRGLTATSNVIVPWLSHRTSSSLTALTTTDTTGNISVISLPKSSDKRGICFTGSEVTRAFVAGQLAWAYNWASSPRGAINATIDHVPMLWSPKYTTSWFEDAQTALNMGSQHVLSFNEPDIHTQANMTPVDAAATHIRWINPWHDRALIGSPAVSNANQTEPVLRIGQIRSDQ